MQPYMDTIRQFGLVLHGVDPRNLTQDTIRQQISQHGVVVFRGEEIDHAGQMQVMSKLGRVQTSVQQQAPHAYADPLNQEVILLDNDDFLGKSRMGWHTDQTYLMKEYLPLRSLYCTHVDGINVTEFADVAYLTSSVQASYALSLDTMARYYIDSARTRFSQRSVFAQCDHVGRPLLRYDNRMEFVDRQDSLAFKDFCRSILNGMEIPKLSISWQVNDFVIFDNNQCPHRRAVMNGDCRLSRITSSFWME